MEQGWVVQVKRLQMFCAKMGGVDSGRTPAGRSGMQSGKRNLTPGSVNKELQPLALCEKSFIHWHSLYKECFHKNDKYHYQTIDTLGLSVLDF